MSKVLKSALTAFAVLVLFYAVASVLGTLSLLADAADRASPGAGTVVFWSLLVVFALLAATPVWLYLRLPKPLKPPASSDDPAYPAYLAALTERLGANRELAGTPVIEPAHIPAALQVLDAAADRATLQAASATFVSTALMQNGRLDGLIVLATQFRLVWRIAALYYVRPSPRQALYVYSNVGAAVLLSTSIEDVDFSELASPIVAGVAPALAASVPGLGGVSRLLVNSLANGAANAFLTLRVGMLTKQYCAALVRPEPVAVRRTASIAALALLGNVTRDGGARVSKAILQAAGSSLGGAANAAAQGARNVGARAGQAARAAADAVSNVTDQVVGAAGSMVSATARAGQRLVGRGEPAAEIPALTGDPVVVPSDRVPR